MKLSHCLQIIHPFFHHRNPCEEDERREKPGHPDVLAGKGVERGGGGGGGGDGIYKCSLETGRGLDIKGRPSDKLFLLSSPQAARPPEALGA